MASPSRTDARAWLRGLAGCQALAGVGRLPRPCGPWRVLAGWQVSFGAVAAYYLRSVPTAGNDVMFDVVLAAIGATLGTLCALATHMRRGADGVVLARAGVAAAALWVIGIGARIGFALWSSHGGGPAIERFSIAHSITSRSAWVAAMVMMALAEVLARTAVLRLRASALPAVSGAPAAQPAGG
jgi:hypothetical protein